jgi:hypothetical protein
MFQPSSLILAVGMQDLKVGFSGVDFIGSTRLGRIAEKIMSRIGERRVSYAAEKMHLLTMVEEINVPTGIMYDVTPGFFKKFIYFKAGYYQSEKTVDINIAIKISVKPEFLARADHFLASFKIDRNNLFFVHVRRGDYTDWPSRVAPAVLPLFWYRAQMERIRAANPNALFVVVSDDKPYVDELLGVEKDVVIYCNDMMSDFAVMTGCLGGGILSASSYSWWASYFVRQGNSNAFFIAPNYWAGHRGGSWYPSLIQTSWINYVQVE